MRTEIVTALATQVMQCTPTSKVNINAVVVKVNPRILLKEYTAVCLKLVTRCSALRGTISNGYVSNTLWYILFSS